MPRLPAKPGFALIIVLTLMALLVLLFVTLTVSIQIASQQCAYNLKTTQAQLNALYGVNVAMAQLQKFAGPDTRVTGTADLARRDDANDPSTSLPASFTYNGTSFSYSSSSTMQSDLDDASGIGVGGSNAPSANGGTRYWTGVWGNAAPGYGIFQGSSPAGGGGNTTLATMPTPVLLTWLVSGDENTTLDLAQNGTTKQITIASTTAAKPVFSPATVITSGNSTITANTTATTALSAQDVTVNGSPANFTLLVGPNSAGNTSTSITVSSNGTAYPVTQLPQSRYVAAPLVSLIEPGESGGISASYISSGSYAYWVGDEGVKARYNLVDNNSADASTLMSVVTNYSTGTTDGLPKADTYVDRLMAPQRNAIEEMDSLPTYPANNSTLNNVMDPLEAHYVGVTGDPIMSNVTLADDPIRAHFHDITTYSMGVLSDSQLGGLKYDLTTAFETPKVFSSDLQGKKILPDNGTNDASGNNTINTNLASSTNLANPYYGAPSISPAMGPFWDSLQAYYNIGVSANSSLATTSAIPIQPGVIPVIVQGRLLMGVLLDSGEQVDMTLNAGFVLSNPYNYTISANKGLNLNYTINTHTKSEWGFYFAPGPHETAGTTLNPGLRNSYETIATAYPNAKAASGAASPYYAILPNFVDDPSGSSNPSLLGNLTFHLSDAGTSTGSLTLLPGQTKLYTILGSATTPSLDMEEKTSPLNGNFSYVGITLGSAGARTLQLGANLTSSTSNLANYVIVQTGQIYTPAPTSATDVLVSGFMPSVACTLQVFAPTGSVFTSSGAATTTPTILQSIMGLDLTGDGMGGTIPNIPLNIKNLPSGDQGTVTDGATAGSVPHYVCGYYFWLGLPDSASFYSIGTYNYANYSGGGGASGASETGISSAQVSGNLTLTAMPLMDLCTGNVSFGNNFKGLNYRTFTDFNLRAVNVSLPPSALLNPLTPDGYTGITSSANNTAYNGFPNVPPYLRFFDPTAGDNSQPSLVNSDTQFMRNSFYVRNLGTWSGSGPVTPEWGYANNSDGQPYVMLYSLPWRTPSVVGKTNSLPVLSLGQLQHADVTADDIFNSVSYQPGNAVGNSYASPFVGMGQSIFSVKNNASTYLSNGGTALTSNQLGAGANFTLGPGATKANANMYDMSYLINAALWDHYYFSGIAQGGANTTAITGANLTAPPSTATGQISNPRMKFAAGYAPTNAQLNIPFGTNGIANVSASMADLETNSTSQQNYMPQGYGLARYLLNSGAFNVNSTSVEAWKAVLASLRGLPPSASGSQLTTDSTTAPNPTGPAANAVLAFPRVAATLVTGTNATYQANYTFNGTGSDAPNAGDSDQSYAGYRVLSDEDINNLATAIVQQVRARGPFLSLAQFVNRRLDPANNDPMSVSGALQSAIDSLPLVNGA
ncbi:MAG: hypothetical protein ABSH19_03750, partial [Opitutales bacterium]